MRALVQAVAHEGDIDAALFVLHAERIEPHALFEVMDRSRAAYRLTHGGEYATLLHDLAFEHLGRVLSFDSRSVRWVYHGAVQARGGVQPIFLRLLCGFGMGWLPSLSPEHIERLAPLVARHVPRERWLAALHDWVVDRSALWGTTGVGKAALMGAALGMNAAYEGESMLRTSRR